MDKKVKCMNRLFELLQCKNEIIEFLLKEKLVDVEEKDHIVLSHVSGHAGKLFSILDNAMKEDKVQLLDFEWSILPKETLSLTIVTNMDKLHLNYES